MGSQSKGSAKDSNSSAKDRRVIAIGDVHGCALELDLLLRRLRIEKDDLLIFLGDYVDRGEDSRQVIDVILEVSSRCEVVALKGNHEAMLLDFLNHPESIGAGLFVLNGGTSTLASYAGPSGYEFPEEHLNFFNGLKLFHQTDTHFFVHAGVPEIPLRDIDVDEHEMTMMWTRQPFLNSDYNWGKIIVHGHTPVPRVEVKANRINLDTGCVYGGQLTALELPSKKFFHVAHGNSSKPPLYIKDQGPARRALRYQGRIEVQAGRPGEKATKFETLNYNQFGLLIKDLEPDANQTFEIGDKIEGRLGNLPNSELRFEGNVVRAESRGSIFVYGVRIEKMTGDELDPAWVMSDRSKNKIEP